MCRKIHLIYLILIFLIFGSNSFSIENKIIFKVDQEIITSIDLENEYRYLIALNKNIRIFSVDCWTNWNIRLILIPNNRCYFKI